LQKSHLNVTQSIQFIYDVTTHVDTMSLYAIAGQHYIAKPSGWNFSASVPQIAA